MTVHHQWWAEPPLVVVAMALTLGWMASFPTAGGPPERATGHDGRTCAQLTDAAALHIARLAPGDRASCRPRRRALAGHPDFEQRSGASAFDAALHPRERDLTVRGKSRTIRVFAPSICVEVRVSRSSSRHSREQPQPLRVPGWYYSLLAVIALVGAILIVVSMRSPSVDTAGLTTAEGDYPKGRPDAPVTIMEWGSFV